MGKLQFQFLLGGLTHVYYAGQRVSGRLTIINDVPVEFNAISIVVYGAAVVKWRSEHNNSHLRQEEVVPNFSNIIKDEKLGRVFKDSEVYFQKCVTILNAADCQDKKLQPGQHSFNFSFTLPEDLPASFKGYFGHIKYSVEAVMDRPHLMSSHKSEALFDVIGPLDLNDYPSARHSVSNEMTMMVCCLWCTSGPVNAVLSLETVGVVPGGTLLATVDLENYSRCNIVQITLKFVKVETYKATSGTRTLTYELTIVKKKIARHVESGQSCTVEREKLQIPPNLLPSKLMNCNIIDIEYTVEAKITMDGCTLPIEVSVPVLVGTIPLSENRVEAPEIEAIEQSFNPADPQIETPPTYPDIAPPTFEESLAMLPAMVTTKNT